MRGDQPDLGEDEIGRLRLPASCPPYPPLSIPLLLALMGGQFDKKMELVVSTVAQPVRQLAPQRQNVDRSGPVDKRREPEASKLSGLEPASGRGVGVRVARVAA